MAAPAEEKDWTDPKSYSLIFTEGDAQMAKIVFSTPATDDDGPLVELIGHLMRLPGVIRARAQLAADPKKNYHFIVFRAGTDGLADFTAEVCSEAERRGMKYTRFEQTVLCRLDDMLKE